MNHKHGKVGNRLIVLFFAFILFIVCSIPGHAEDTEKEHLLSVHAEVDRDSIVIGDKITYKIIVETEKHIEVEFPQFAENLAGFAIKDFGTEEKWRLRGKKFFYWYVLDTYASGTYTIPEVTIRYRKKGSEQWQEKKTKAVTIEVKGLIDDATAKDIRDIRGPVDFPIKIWIYFFLGIVVVLILLGITFLFFRKKKKKQIASPPKPAHEIAYEALKALKEKEYIQDGRIESYYVELSDIVRHYLEKRFSLRAPEMTTEEFLNKVKNDKVLSFGHTGLLTDFLSQCDFVKFAKYKPLQDEIHSSFESAERFIDQTKEVV